MCRSNSETRYVKLKAKLSALRIEVKKKMRWNTAANQKLCLVYMLNYLQMKTGITATIIYLWFSQQAMSNSLVTPWTIAH